MTLTDNSIGGAPATPASPSFAPGPVLLLGAPGVGKGTQAQILMGRFGIPQISTGDLFRSNISAGTPLGVTAKGYLDSGQLVPDDLVNQMVRDRLRAPDTRQGYVLDGFPRTLQQAEWLDRTLAASRQGSAEESAPVVALSLVVPFDDLLHRITGRYTCPKCKRIYNVYSNPPQVDRLCDLDGTPLEQRADDTEAVFRDRMTTFAAQTAPVIDHYRQQSRFAEVDGNHPVEEVAASIASALSRLRSPNSATPAPPPASKPGS